MCIRDRVNPSSAAPGNAWGHCKDNGGGHPNQAPAGCTTSALVFDYTYDARGLVAQRDVSTDGVTTSTPVGGDGYASVRTVNAINEVTAVVEDPFQLPSVHTTTTAYAYDARGNRTSEVTTRATGNATHVPVSYTHLTLP